MRNSYITYQIIHESINPHMSIHCMYYTTKIPACQQVSHFTITQIGSSFRVVHTFNKHPNDLDFSDRFYLNYCLNCEFKDKDKPEGIYDELCDICIRKYVFDMIDKWDTQNAKRARQRAMAKVKELVVCNQWDYFVTLTVDGSKCNRFNIKEIIERIRYSFNPDKKEANIDYLLVPEFHKNGAIHFHGFMTSDAVQLTSFRDLQATNVKIPLSIKNTLKYHDVFKSQWLESNLGYNTFTPINDSNKAVKYCRKYMAKDVYRNQKLQQAYYRSDELNNYIDLGFVDVKFNKHNLETFDIIEPYYAIKDFNSFRECTDFIKTVIR